MSELSKHLSGLKKRFLEGQEERGGKAEGFREFVSRRYRRDKAYYDALTFEALMEAATKQWQQKPRRRGPDLFSINGYDVPEYLTRPTNEYFSAADLEDEDEEFEKVDAKFATVQDLYSDGMIKTRKSLEAAAAAREAMNAVDEARRRARGNMAAFLRDIADGETGELAAE